MFLNGGIKLKKVSLWSFIFLSVLVLALVLSSCSMFVASAPTNLSAVALSSQSVQLSWNSTAKEFVIYRGLSSNGTFVQIATSNATNYTDTGLTPSTTYFYQVKAKNQYGLSASSKTVSVTTLMAAPQPPVLNVTAFSTDTISLSWSESSTGIQQFKIYRASGDSAFAQLQIFPGNVLSYTDKHLTPVTTYTYRMIATNEGGNSSFSNTVVQMTNGLPPKAPTELSVTSYSTNTINLLWKNNSKSEKGFELYQSTSTSLTGEVTKVGSEVTSYSATGLIPNTTYIYRVRAFNKWGYSDFSNIVAQMTKGAGTYFPVKNGKVDRVEISMGTPLIDQLGENPSQKAFEGFFSSFWYDFSTLSKPSLTTQPSSLTIKEDVIYEATGTSANSTMINYQMKIPEAYAGKPRKMETLLFNISKESSTVFFDGIPLIDNGLTGNASGTALLSSPKGVFERTSSYVSLSVGTSTYNDVLKVDLVLNNLKREFYFAHDVGIIKLNDYLLNQQKIWKFISGMTVVEPNISNFEYNPEPATIIAPKMTDLATSTQITMTWQSTSTNVKYDLYLEKMGEWVKEIGSATKTYFNFEKLPTGVYTWMVVSKNASGLSTVSRVATFTVNMGEKVTFKDHNLEQLIRTLIGIPEGPLYTSELLGIKVLSNNWPSPDSAITSLDGIQYLKNLQKLELVGNDITDLSPLKYLKDLKELNLSHNSISDITPLASLTNLEELDLSYNKISEISPLASLTNLKTLNLSNNMIKDISVISGLKNLQVLDLSSNSVKDVTPLKGIGQSLLSLDISYNPIPASQLGFIQSWTQLHNLGMGGFNLKNSEITFLSKFTNLTSLDLGFNRISNITPLASLTSLQSLFLYSNLISDVSPLSNLKNLEWLNIGSNLISDVSPIGGLKKLTFLDLSLNRISNISPLTDLSNLETLDLNFNRITLNYTPTFASMLHLLWIMLDSNEISNFSILSTAPDLWILDIASNNISDLSPLSNMNDLLRVDLESNEIKDMGSIVSNLNLGIGSIVNVKNNYLNLSASNILNEINTLEGRGVNVLYQPQNSAQ
jgi:Leucine-rich repeat (LRR) protein/fibronectin type 3 domain-containing protein|uniref:Fibronectin type-III domain-containing protein n=1 Tax=Mesoaciditoga lauensis TaxID=1495039 RepID=A0A7V3RDY0_9BACT